MPPDPSEPASVLLAAVVLLFAAGLVWKERSDRSNRNPDLSPEDDTHFARQDTRRTLGIVVMGLLALGLVVGSRVEPRLANKANPAFLAIWLGVALLIFSLLGLAMVDWVSLRLYARRQRRVLARQRDELIREEYRRRREAGRDGNGHSGGGVDELFEG
jgi:hypothetical protein